MSLELPTHQQLKQLLHTTCNLFEKNMLFKQKKKKKKKLT